MLTVPLTPTLRRLARALTPSHRRPAGPARFTLEAGAAMPFDAAPRRPVTLHVVRGMVWLTTPAAGDVILRAGDDLAISRPCRIVVQALDEDAVLDVTRR